MSLLHWWYQSECIDERLDHIYHNTFIINIYHLDQYGHTVRPTKNFKGHLLDCDQSVEQFGNMPWAAWFRNAVPEEDASLLSG